MKMIRFIFIRQKDTTNRCEDLGLHGSSRSYSNSDHGTETTPLDKQDLSKHGPEESKLLTWLLTCLACYNLQYWLLFFQPGFLWTFITSFPNLLQFKRSHLTTGSCTSQLEAPRCFDQPHIPSPVLQPPHTSTHCRQLHKQIHTQGARSHSQIHRAVAAYRTRSYFPSSMQGR